MSVLRIGRYRLLERLGSGATSEVYVAEDVTLHRKVALKLMKSADATAADIRNFEAEARCAAMVNHPNIVTVFDAGAEGDLQFIATELVIGESLRQRLMRSSIPLTTAIDVALGVAQALVAAHESWIVHRDIKPENIMLRADGCVKVVDFSISRLAGLGDDTDPVRRRGGIGTLHYLSPEQVRGEPIIDTRSDVFSLGVVLYEMLAGHPPFRGEPMNVLAAIVEQPTPPLPAGVPLAVEAIVQRATMKDMYERYQTAADMLDALNEVKVGLMVRARAITAHDFPPSPFEEVGEDTARGAIIDPPQEKST